MSSLSSMAIATFPTWTPASRCTGGPAAGALALMRWFVEQYGDLGGYNLGIYNCRDVRGGHTTSMHGEGRACDFGFPVGDPDGWALLLRLLANVDKLGIQCIIYRRRIYSKKNPQGAPYTGVAPHWDHLHVELTPTAARRLTYTTVATILTEKVWKLGERDLMVGARGADVTALQRKLAARYPRQHIVADGIYGEATKRAVRRFELEQKGRGYTGLKVDGVAGSITFKALAAPKPVVQKALPRR